jgi:prolyl oligopeptidase
MQAYCGSIIAGGRPLKQRLVYPVAPRSNVDDIYFGTSVADPYRSLEDLDAPETRAWLEAEDALTQAYLGELPQRTQLCERLTELWNYERIGEPLRKGGRHYYVRNEGLQEHAVLYARDSPDTPPRILLDPNELSKDGTISLGAFSVSHDGNLLAYATQDGGSDWLTWRVRDVSTRVDLPDEISWSKFSTAAWLGDNSGFFYAAYDPPHAGETLRAANREHKLYLHKLGATQAEDILVYARPDRPTWNFSSYVTSDGRYCVIDAHDGTDPRNCVFYLDLKDRERTVRPLFTEADAAYQFIDHDGPRWYFQTDRDAPLGRIVAVDLAAPESFEEIVAQDAMALEVTTSAGGRFFARYLSDASTKIRVFDRQGRFERDVALPGIGTASGFEGERDDRDTYYSFASFTTPPQVLRYEIESGESFPETVPGVAFDPSLFVTEQIFATSNDGTRVPMFVMRRRDLVRDGTARTVLYGYGGFNISLTPLFSPARILWLERGGVFAVANLRGGTEYGEEWHRAGTLDRKQNVFDDFIACAELLVAERYTSSARLAIAGGSNGGLLVGAAITQRPELFGAALPAVGVLDMLRFHRFTIGHAWIPEYGAADASEAEFLTLRAYSPLHNLKAGTTYPATMITTADHDDRVYPAHSFKFAAALQAAQGGPAPILLRVEMRGGHGAGKPTNKVIADAADDFAFLFSVLNGGEKTAPASR